MISSFFYWSWQGFYIGYRRLALTDLLPDFSHGIGFYGWPVLQGAWRAVPLIAPYANPQEGQGTFFFPSDQLFQLDKVFYAGIGYLLVFGIVYSIGRLFGLLLHLLPSKNWGVSCSKFQQVSCPCW